MRKLICAAIILTLPLAAPTYFSIAGDTHYVCTVVSASSLTTEGVLAPHWTVKFWVDQQFTVDRETGRIIGGPLDNAKMKIQVLDRGSHEMSFQAFAQSRQTSHSAHLEIEEFRTAESKPFVGTTTLYYPGVYSGTCK